MSHVPAELLEHARGAWVGVDIDATGPVVGVDQVTHIGLCVQSPVPGLFVAWSTAIYVPRELVDDEAPLGVGRDALEVADELQAIARVARGFVCDNAFSFAARFLAAFPWRVWGPWYDVRARFRATHPGAWAPSLRMICDALRIERPWPEHTTVADARAALKAWLQMDAAQPLAGAA